MALGAYEWHYGTNHSKNVLKIQTIFQLKVVAEFSCEAMIVVVAAPAAVVVAGAAVVIIGATVVVI